MFRSKTVFIIGAGASAEYGLPVGDKLKSRIQGDLNIVYEDFGRRHSGDRLIVRALEHLVKGIAGDPYNINRLFNIYLQASMKISQALPHDISIDSVLETYSDDEKIVQCGKLGIARAVLNAEQNSSLRADQGRSSDSIDFLRIIDKWKAALLRLLKEGITTKSIESLFENVSFVNFNYDRCFEHYLHSALQPLFGVDANRATELMKTVTIVHPYGTVGSLDWQRTGREHRVTFGAEVNAERLLASAQSILTYGERADDPDRLGQLSTVLDSAQRVIFLGFAFHPQNMDLLFRAGGFGPKEIWATAYDISQDDIEIIKRDIRKRQYNVSKFLTEEVQISNMTCSDLFSNYSRSLAA